MRCRKRLSKRCCSMNTKVRYNTRINISGCFSLAVSYTFCRLRCILKFFVGCSYYMLLSFDRAMLAQSAVMRLLSSVCLSVCLSVMFRYQQHIGWNSWKLISRPNSLRPLLWLTPTWAIWCNGNTPKIRVE